MYRAFALLQPGSDFTLNEAVARLAARFPRGRVSRADDQITVAQGSWGIELRLSAGPTVRDESVRIAEQIAGLEDGTDIESCDRRVEVWSETPDPFVQYLSDFHMVLETLRTFTGVILVDPTEPSLM